MIRILALLLAMTIGAPASVWAGSDLPANVELLGMGCCPTQSAQQIDHRDPQFTKACCCSPSHAATASTISQLGPPSNDSLLVPASSISMFEINVERGRAHAPMSYVAQARPPPWSLLQQHTLLLI